MAISSKSRVALAYVMLFLVAERVFSFTTVIQSYNVNTGFARSSFPKNTFLLTRGDFRQRLSANEDDEESEDDGMKKAFDSLNDLSELNLDEKSPFEIALEKRQEKKGSDSATNTEAPEEELKIYSEMYSELQDKGEDELYDDVLGELGGSSKASDSIPEMDEIVESFEDADDIGNLFDEDNKDDFMNRAIAEAVQEAQDAKQSDLAEQVLSDEELMKEIEKVFDEANKKILEGVEDIRKEQAELTQANAEKRAEIMKEEEARLAEAEGSINRLVSKVSEETLAVESAIKDLERAKEEMDADPLVKIANLRNAGVLKQGSFVLAALFAVRSLTDLVLIVGPNSGSHAVAAAVQFGLAVVFGFIFLL